MKEPKEVILNRLHFNLVRLKKRWESIAAKAAKTRAEQSKKAA